MRIGRLRFQKKYIAFFAVTPLLLATSLIQVSCPVCGGSGSIGSNLSMTNVRITNIRTDEKYVERNFCETYIIYKYNVSLTLNNDDAGTAKGWLQLVLKEYRKARVMDIQYVAVELPPTTTADYFYVVWYRTGLDAPLLTEIQPEVVKGEVPDETCGGTGHIALNNWLLVKFLSNNLREKSQVHQEFKPPVYSPPANEPGGPGE